MQSARALRAASGESVEALRRLFDGTASYTIRNVGRGLISINSRDECTEPTPSIGSRMCANSADLVVTSVDKNCVYAAHVGGSMPKIGDHCQPSSGDHLLRLPKARLRNDRSFTTPWRSGNYLLDLTRFLRKGHVCAVVGETGTGKSTLAASLRSNSTVVVCAETTQNRYEGAEKVTVNPDHWGAPQHAWLAPLRGLHRAIALSKEHEDVTLILDDLALFRQLERSAERPFFTVAQVVNAISAYAGWASLGHLSVALVVDGAPEDEMWQVAESVSDMTLNFNDIPSRPFWPLAMPVAPGGDVLDRVASDLFVKLRDGLSLKTRIDLLGDLKMHVDFWESDDVVSMKSATSILDQFGDPASEHYTTEMIILARACSIFHFPSMAVQEVASFIKTLFGMCREDGIFDHEVSLDALDRALLRYRHRIDCLRPIL